MNVAEELDFDFFETPRNDDKHNGKSDLNANKKSPSPVGNRTSGQNGRFSNGSYPRERSTSHSEKSEKHSYEHSRRSYGTSSGDSETESETPRYEKKSSKTRSMSENNKGTNKYKSVSSSESSSAYSNSDFSSDESASDDQSGDREKIDIRMPNPQLNAWESESKRHRDKKLNNSASVSSDSDSDFERGNGKNKSTNIRVMSGKRREQSDKTKDKTRMLRSRSSSYSNNSDITDVSPLESPETSPRYSRKQYKDNENGRQVQYGTDSPERDANINLETDQIDLSILMKCMADIDREKQQRIKTNSRRVAFASTSSVGEKSKGNYTFSVGRAKLIEKENQRLLKQIMMQMNSGTTKKVSGSASKAPKRSNQPVVQRLTPSAVNRMKQQRRIEMENMQMLGRLQTVRPTRGMSREEQIVDAERIMSYGLPSGTMVMAGDLSYYDPKPYRVTHSSMSHTAGLTQRSRPSSAKSNASTVTAGKRSRPSSAKSNASMISNASMRSNVSKRSTRSNASMVGVRRMADGKVDHRPAWDDRFSYS